MSPEELWSCSFKQVLQAELNAVGDREDEKPEDRANLEEQIARAHKKQLVGLAFSGGGIRSATFNLGVLQAFAQMKLLGEFDYLSTVSGGGYVGSWLMAWIKRRGLKDVQAALSPDWGKQPGQSEPEEIRFLRRFSNYLTPKLGWLGADMWTVIATYLRNLVLNLIVLIAAMTFLLLFPRLLAMGATELWGPRSYPWWALAAIAAVTFAQFRVTRSLQFFRRKISDERKPEMTREDYEQREAVNLFADGRADRWKYSDGQRIDRAAAEAVQKADIWFDQEYSDFVLKTEFALEPAARSAVHVWQERTETSDGWRATGGHVIHISQEPLEIPGGGSREIVHSAGAIDDAEPVRAATLLPQDNLLEVVCVKQNISVTLNGETINKRRIAGRPGGSKPGVIGLSKTDGVKFGKLYVWELPSTLDRGGTQGQIQRRIVLPLFLAAFLGTFLFYFGDFSSSDWTPALPGLPMRGWIDESAKLPIQPWTWTQCAIATGGITARLFLVVRLVLLLVEARKINLAGVERSKWWRTSVASILCETISIGVACFVAGYGVLALYRVFKGRTLWEVMTWGTPAIILLSTFALTLHIGLLGRRLPDEVREWWSRLGAWLLIYSLLWVALFGIAFYAAAFIDYLSSLASLLSLGWLASTVSGVLAARSATTGNTKSGKLRELVAQITPYIFIVGLFLFLSWGIDSLVPRIANYDVPPVDAQTRGIAAFLSRHWWIMDKSDSWCAIGILGAVSIAVTALFSWRLDINQFSMHLLYRNRLGRCYLGASNRFRRAQPFTGFAADDDFNLWELEDLRQKDGAGKEGQKMTAPYLIINAALNLVGGKELAWQQRKAASFVFTQKYCGYEFPELPPGYSPTVQYAASPSPVSLATAMAISGAAASPNMGYHTSPASAFLMTVFNVRLGWWLGNPRKQNAWQKSSPGNVLLSLMSELFGLTSEQGKFIYLSDGGHFENLGIYELVRRRCRFIVACDAEEDHSFGFGGLGNAIEKCRSDFGIDLELDVEPIRHRSETGYSEWHCAIGKIHYSRVDENGRDGILVYLKSSLTGDEPTDVLRYAAENPEFPHQSTGDQWFNESQFESYRALGFHIAQKVFGAVDAIENLSKRTKEELFVELAQRWYPPSAAIEESFTKHTRAVAAIYEELRTNKNLAFLSEQIYPQWRTVLQATYPAPLPRSGERLTVAAAKALREEEFRAGFYICNSVLQVMESVYLDLRLEQESDHPDNRGWMNFFRHWSWAPMFRVTWTISASNYGARFQSFCERHLNLKIGQIVVDKLEFGLSTKGIERWLNKTERELIDLFLKHNLALTECAEIYALQLTPDVGSDPDLSFPFGFAILATTNLPEAPPLLVYFRVQDHLRKMGLARQALEALLKQKPALEAKLYEMNPKAHEVPTLDDQTQFDTLFDSVKTEMRQKGEKKAVVGRRVLLPTSRREAETKP